MKLLELSPKAYQYYCEELNDNKHTSYDVARKKMTRNMLLSHKADSTGQYAQLYCYGSLHFLVKGNTVIKIMNRRNVPKGWKLDKNEYVRLNKELRIDGRSKINLIWKDVKQYVKRRKNKLKWKIKGLSNK